MNHKTFHFSTSLLFLLLGIIFLFFPKGWFPSFYHVSFMTGVFFLSALLIYFPKIFLHPGASERKSNLIEEMQSALAVALLLNNGGELGLFQLYRYGFEYDKFSHFLVCMLFSFVLAESLRAWEHLAKWRIFFLTLSIIFTGGILWEVLELGSDLLFHTQEWGVYGAGAVSDTLKDLFFNTLGAVSGLIIFLIPRKKNLQKREKKQNHS